MLVVIDEYTRESLAIEVARSFTGRAGGGDPAVPVGGAWPARLYPQRQRPGVRGPEVRRWLERACIQTLFIAKGSPWENGYIESFNSRFRDELLDRELFLGLEDARWVIDRWRMDYNHHRPHSALDYQTPAAFAASCSASLRFSAYGLTPAEQLPLTTRSSHSQWHIDRGKASTPYTNPNRWQLEKATDWTGYALGNVK